MKRLAVLAVVIVVVIAFAVPGLPGQIRDMVHRLLSLLGLD